METPRSDAYNDIYFCEEDGLAEGFHVFLKGNKLPEAWADEPQFTIAETGFGTGLNFLASWMAWEDTAKADQHLTYVSFEKFPLTKEHIDKSLSRWRDQFGDKLDLLLANYPIRAAGWHNIRITKNITLLLIFDDVNRALPELNAQVDAWFLDGFAPAKNPEMWSETVFKAMAANSHSKTTVASFTAAGLVKNGLRAVGFHIAKTRGFGRKRDMIYGHFQSEKEKRKPRNIKSVAVIGGGLAGTNIASRLYEEGIAVDLYEENKIAAGASGNARGLFNPRFTAARGPVSDFYASAFALALRQFAKFDDIGFHANGSLHLLTDADKEKRLRGAVDNWGWHQDHMRILTADEASAVADVKIDTDALFLPEAGFVSPEKLCLKFAQAVTNRAEKVTAIEQGVNGWAVNGRNYDAVVIASGAGVLNLAQTGWIPLSTVRGQISYAPQTTRTKNIKTNICYGGYFSAAADDIHVIGSTFQPWLSDSDVKDEDHADILANFEKHVPELAGEMKITGGRAALRVASKDRFPVVGAVPDYENLYVSAAHGSHGLISSALSAEIIAADIGNRVQPVPNSVLWELSARRFIDRAAKKTAGIK